ncbi:hypothetical protein [Agromyces silvae]|uniref:hypothetical protein n=1 Tax=Agromyces silvae TaxID=3388266 RepID=UPI00280B9ECC|nr:hypothetical protein [Agromyces protaetiae]
MALGLSACGPAGAVPSPSASPSEAPVFGSDDDAVAAAVATYERYLVVNAEINADQGADAERILEVTTNRYGTQLLADYRDMRQAGVHITGAAVLRSSHLVEIDGDRNVIVLGMCVDVGPTRYINEDGVDVTPEGKDLASLEVTFNVTDNSRVLLNGSEQWSGEALC